MSPRILNAVNAAGVLALGGLAFVQWRDNAALRTRVETADRTAATAASESAALNRALAVAKADLDDFRARLTRADETRRALEAELATATRRAATAEVQVASLKDNVAAWHDAVKARDARLAEYATELDKARAAHADAVARHNALVAEHNTLATRFTRLLDALGPDAAPVKLTVEAVPTLTRITEPGKPPRALTAAEAAAHAASIVGRQGHSYATPYAPTVDGPAPTLIEGERFRLYAFPDGSARFEREDLRVHLPAATAPAASR